MIKPKAVTIKDGDGGEKEFFLSKLPAIPMREVMAKYPVSNIPKLGEYNVSKEIMLTLMSYVSVGIGDDGRMQPLSTESLINSHVITGEQLLRLEWAMLEYNTSFFGQGRGSTFFASLIKTHLPLIIQTLTDSLPPSLVRDLRAKLNSTEK
jgi:hypothetical protein